MTPQFPQQRDAHSCNQFGYSIVNRLEVTLVIPDLADTFDQMLAFEHSNDGTSTRTAEQMAVACLAQSHLYYLVPERAVD